MGFDDSKKIKEEDREKVLFFIQIFAKIKSLAGKCLVYKTKIMSADYLNRSSFQIPLSYNLNENSHDAAISLVNELF